MCSVKNMDRSLEPENLEKLARYTLAYWKQELSHSLTLKNKKKNNKPQTKKLTPQNSHKIYNTAIIVFYAALCVQSIASLPVFWAGNGM